MRKVQDEVADGFCGESFCFYQGSDLLFDLDNTAKEEITAQLDYVNLRTNFVEVFTLTGMTALHTSRVHSLPSAGTS